MSKRNQSFFERLTGTITLSDEDNQYNEQAAVQQSPDEFEDDFQNNQYDTPPQHQDDEWGDESGYEQEDAIGELAVDMYETPDHIVIQTMVAGVRPDQLDVAITRDQCTVTGRREGARDVPPEDYMHQELYWGEFSRTVDLPEEVEVDTAEANESHGLLTITLPKISTDRETRLEINSE